MLNERNEKILMTGIVLLVLAIGFLAGRLSVKLDVLSKDDPIQTVGQISDTVPTIHFTSFRQGLLYGTSNGEDLRLMAGGTMVERKEDGTFFIDTSSIKEDPALSNVNGDNAPLALYVASKNSKVYHLVGSSAANGINPENKIYFESKEAAEKAGFRAGSGVK